MKQNIQNENSKLEKISRCFCRWFSMRIPKKSNMKLLIVSIAVLIPFTIAQTVENEDYLSFEIDTEFQNIENLLASLNDAELQEQPNDPNCLKYVIRAGLWRIGNITAHFKRLMDNDNDNDTSTSKPDLDLQQSDLYNQSRVFQDSNGMNNTIHRLRDISSSLNMAVNTLRYIRQDFNAELEKDEIRDSYDVEGELKMECDTLKGMLGITTQLARRLMPLKIRQKLASPQNPIIRVMQRLLKF